MKFKFESNNKLLQQHLDELAKQITPAAQVSTLNKAAKKFRTESLRRTAASTGVPQKLLKKRFAVPKRTKATRRRSSVIVFAGTWPIRVAKLNPPPRKLKGGKTKYKVIKGEQYNPNAFLANNSNGRPAVFVRKTTRRLPVKNVTADIEPAVNLSMLSWIGSPESKNYWDKTLFSELDRRVRSSLRRRGMDVS